jgi:PAS domain S-box-containing protein
MKANQTKSSQYARSLIEASLDPLVAINIAGKITDMNQAMANITGYSRNELTGTDFFDYFTEPQKAREVYQEVFAKGSVSGSPLTLQHYQGKLTDVLFNGSVYKDGKGKVLGVVIVARDVTEQKRIARELMEAKIYAELATEIAQEAKRKAEKLTVIAEAAVKSKQQFLSNMSHEIRTPMNGIIGFTKVVLKTELSKKQEEYLNAIKTSGDALIVLINDILDLAKVDAGKMTFSPVPFKLSSSIAAMLHLFETKILEKNLELVKEYDKSIPSVIVGDPVRLHQIILNLVSNAVKFTSEGKITVSVRMIKQDAETVTIEFAIKDTGIGIAENKLGCIFDDFQQATSGTSRLYGGTGLGLAIVKQLVEPQGGKVTVESVEGKGTTFAFSLSFLKTKAKTIREPEQTMSHNEGLKDIKILVVEDIVLNQLLMRTLLDDFGFAMDIADNGRIAVDMLAAQKYDLVLMDLQMPEMNGFEATKFIRKQMGLKMPIIALTADVTTADVEKCKAVGMNDYISKPIDDRLLYNKIIKYLKKSSRKKEIADQSQSTSASPKYTNLSYLDKRTRSNKSLMHEMITIYLAQTPPLLKMMKEGMKNKDWESVHSAVHKMIPSFSIMGISPETEKLAKKLQEYSGSETNINKIPGLVVEIEKVCLQAFEELRSELKSINSPAHDK